MYIQHSSIVPRSVSCELEGVRLCPGRLPWLQFQWSLPQRHTTLPTGACLSAPARGLRVNPREWFSGGLYPFHLGSFLGGLFG